jgi:N-acetylated-alpha-linked acidic dipeptidase
MPCLYSVLYLFSEDDLSLQIERLARTDSDFASFLHHAGIPCVDLYYGKGI